jgi:hypothetical protein
VEKYVIIDEIVDWSIQESNNLKGILDGLEMPKTIWTGSGSQEENSNIHDGPLSGLGNDDQPQYCPNCGAKMTAERCKYCEY